MLNYCARNSYSKCILSGRKRYQHNLPSQSVHHVWSSRRVVTSRRLSAPEDSTSTAVQSPSVRHSCMLQPHVVSSKYECANLCCQITWHSRCLLLVMARFGTVRCRLVLQLIPLVCTGNNYSAASNNMKLVHWPLMGGLLHLVQRRGDWPVAVRF